MPRRHTTAEADTQDIGWRLRELRLRRGLSLAALAALAGKHTSQISRLERHWARSGDPKWSTVNELLEAMQATRAERDAVFHEEIPPLSRDEIDEQVAAIAAEYRASRTAVVLLDNHWYRWYINPAAQALLGLSDEECRRSIGEHVLQHMFDPATPLYSRHPEDVRRRLFSWRVAGFQFHYADQQFDEWYLRIASDVERFYWAQQIWQSPPDVPTFADRQVFPILHPTYGLMTYRGQLNTILTAPRFVLSDFAPADEATAQKAEGLLASLGLDAGPAVQ